ncbi:AfsR/SARP family transcriptional regulator [Micromonospora sp. NPDC049044]|uniref:AfsR/SARP family transcriptional regulator n=1 Tax=unclassified Micromonospora TaxID=2617518 RepID=UPI003407458D
MRFGILGPVIVTDDGENRTPRALKLRSLLALLITQGDQIVSTQRLIEELWGGAPPRTANTGLQVYISKLRRHLGDGVNPRIVVSHPSGYQLSLAEHSCDLTIFQQHLAAADRAEAAGLPAVEATELSRALEIYRGPVLADVRGSGLLENVARQYDESRIIAYERRIDLDLRLGYRRNLVGELYGVVAEYPTWENLHEHLMLALYRSGRIAEALRVYRQLHRRLVEELGMEPGPRLKRLHQMVLSRDPNLDPATPYLAS